MDRLSGEDLLGINKIDSVLSNVRLSLLFKPSKNHIHIPSVTTKRTYVKSDGSTNDLSISRFFKSARGSS